MINCGNVRNRISACALGGLLVLGIVGCVSGSSGGANSHPSARAGSDQTPQIAVSINRWHEAAARADFEGYFGLMTSDTVFLGTDATERWGRAEFEEFARPYFSAGRGWRYEPIDRKIIIGNDGQTAWFDERLANAGLGECRGTGVVEMGPDGVWRIAHYSLTIPIPNALAKEVASQIRGLTEPGDQPAEAPPTGDQAADASP